jgi:proteasome lid subunit RPN8/RPN11
MFMETTPKLLVEIKAEVLQAVRQHARLSMSAEVCGVLIGTSDGGLTKVEARIAGEGAAQGGAHVTFTHETWEHIYRVKDQQFPQAAIVGWYHSHPGFGVFLSEYDLFIHRNFFSNPGQVAWVYDPHSDEEGCFIWADGEIVRVSSLAVKDGRGTRGGSQQPKVDEKGASVLVPPKIREKANERRWRRWLVQGGLVAMGVLIGVAVGLLSAFYLQNRRLGGLPQPVWVVVPDKGNAMSVASSNDVRLPRTNIPMSKATDAGAWEAGSRNETTTSMVMTNARDTNTVIRPAGQGKP